jgi:hypothetical protein
MTGTVHLTFSDRVGRLNFNILYVKREYNLKKKKSKIMNCMVFCEK